MALKNTLRDPLNWALLILASAFAYYVMAIPYWQNYYLKEDPQVMTLPAYMDNPSHPREPMLRSLGAPPSSIEVVLEGLTVKHIDTDSITLTSESGSAGSGSNVGACPAPGMIGDEADTPLTDILIAGDNMDLLELSEGQQVALRVFGLFESGLGWIPLEPTLTSEQEERFSKDELDELDQLKIIANGAEITVPYVETGELRLASGVHPAGTPTLLADLADDTFYIQTVNRLQGGLIDLHGVRLVGWQTLQLAPYFIVEDEEGRRAQVYYNQRLLSEWRWGLDRLEGECVIVRGSLRNRTPAELRQLAEDGNIQAIVEGFGIMSLNGSVVINLENPLGGIVPGS